LQPEGRQCKSRDNRCNVERGADGSLYPIAQLAGFERERLALSSRSGKERAASRINSKGPE
jgi:hypothetical protein